MQKDNPCNQGTFTKSCENSMCHASSSIVAFKRKLDNIPYEYDFN